MSICGNTWTDALHAAHSELLVSSVENQVGWSVFLVSYPGQHYNMTLFHLWNLPGDVLAAPESASGLDRCPLSLSLCVCVHACFHIVLHVFGVSGILGTHLGHMLAFHISLSLVSTILR